MSDSIERNTLHSISSEEVEYELEEFIIGEYKFQLTTVAHMPIEILFANHTNGVEVSGQKVWCGSLGLAEYLHDHSFIVANKVVIELGAGTGLLGMLSCRLGCKEAILTDHDQRSLDHMGIDCRKNDIRNAQVFKLDWFDYEKNDILVNNHIISESETVTIIAGDVLYKNPLLFPFFSTVLAIFNRFEKVDMYLCHVPRAGVEQEDVIKTASSFGFNIQAIDPIYWRKGSCTSQCPEEDYNRACVYNIKLNIN